MRAEILAIGTELLMGETVDTNSAFLAARLPALGIELHGVGLLRDHMEEMVPALTQALGRSDIVLVTGGLGPTEDDITRDAIAEAVGEPLRQDPDLAAELARFFQGRSAPMPEANLRQAAVIESATTLPNPRGTAPGWWVEKNGRIIVTMPGVPSEMEGMWENEVVPRLRERSRGEVILSRTIKTFGLAESAVAAPLKGLFGLENPYLGIYARADGIQLRIIAKASTAADAEALAAPIERDIRAALGDVVWGVDGETLEERVGALLRRDELTLATLESCTGGLLASVITDVPGSSDYYRGGVVSYADQVKVAHGVDAEVIERFGVVSAEVSEAMARVIRRRMEADIGVGVTGVAGEEAVAGQPPGTVYIGVAWGDRSESSQLRFPRSRQMVKRRAVTQALFQVRGLLLRGVRS